MKKNGFLDSINVASPCAQDWDAMSGNEKVRFCSHCALEVNNLSALKRKEAMRLVRRSEGRICVRYIKNPVTNAPVFAERLYQITRRAGIAAGVLSASLTLSTLAYAQDEAVNPLPKTQVETPSEKQPDTDKTESKNGIIFGTMTDPTGAFVPGTTVKLVNEKTNESRSTTTNDEGFYQFKDVLPETYTIVVEPAAGFAGAQYNNVRVSEGRETVLNLSVAAPQYSGTVGMMISVEYEQPLLKAVSNEDFDAVKDLIAKGANVNAKDKSYGDSTALHVAVDYGNMEIAKYLLDMGAKINARDKERRTPLMSLDYNATPELARMLLDHRAKVNAFDTEGNTALMFAANNENAEILRVLIDAGARLNAQNKEGVTALMIAAENDYYDSVKVLLEAGADVSLRNKDGENALDLTDDEKIRDLLKSYNAKQSEK
jgi:Ankyrin repeats (3 copies)/Carboxypeptidase regulatory-like domain/Ankyrin repeats (many copies)